MITLTILAVLLAALSDISCMREYSKQDLASLKHQVKEIFYHAYDGYLNYAFPYDELRPLSCDGIDTWGSYSLTLIDALDTLAIMGNYSEFNRVVQLITEKANFDININVSVFETNIRIVGGLLSAHLFSERTGLALEPGWPCNGPLLRLAEDVARRILPAFDTDTGMPYGTVNLKYGVPQGETPVTCTAGVGTFIIEFGTLSRLTGDPIYEEVAMHALRSLYKRKSNLGLFGNHIDTKTGVWTAKDSGIGAGVDSYFEYLVKGAILFQKPELLSMFNDVRRPIERYLKRDDWYLWVSMHKGQVTLPVFQSLEAFWPGVLSLVGDVTSGMKSLHNYHQVWKQYGFLPEFYNIVNAEAGVNRESYPLRPELIESVMYLYRATGDPYLLDVGEDMLESIQHSARTPCGYATIRNVVDHSQEDRMESFFLSETTKYLYLLFDVDNFIHNDGNEGRIFQTDAGKLCVLGAGGYVFNTEAHPIDLAALHCCSSERIGDFETTSNDGEMNTTDKENISREENFNGNIDTTESNEEMNSIKESSNKVRNVHTESGSTDNKEVIKTIVAGGDENNDKDELPAKEDDKETQIALAKEYIKALAQTIDKQNNWFEEIKSNIKKIKEDNEKMDALFQMDLNKRLKQGEALLDKNEFDKFKSELEEFKMDRSKIDMAYEIMDASVNEIKADVLESEGDQLDDTPQVPVEATGEVEKKLKVDENNNKDVQSPDTHDNTDNIINERFEGLNFNEDMGNVRISVNSTIVDTTEENLTEEASSFFKQDCTGLENESLSLCLLGNSVPPREPFNPQKLFEKIRSNRIDDQLLNASFNLLSCQPQSFFTRFSLRGEFFETPP